MTTWDDFGAFALTALLLWAAGAVAAALRRRAALAAVLTAAGICVYAAFIAAYWAGLQRPPLRTIGETRLWYALFIMVAGLASFARWRYRWILAFTTVMAAVFTAMNLLRPEIHDQTLMPALQSGWFVPHVTVYIFAYAVLGCAFLMAVASLFSRPERCLATADSLTCVGAAFLTLGLLSGALWAKDAWGDYWSWDPKETWAAATWAIYLLYIHLRLRLRLRARCRRLAAALLIAGFACLQMCWYGVNYLPAAKGSIHVYAQAAPQEGAVLSRIRFTL